MSLCKMHCNLVIDSVFFSIPQCAVSQLTTVHSRLFLSVEEFLWERLLPVHYSLTNLQNKSRIKASKELIVKASGIKNHDSQKNIGGVSPNVCRSKPFVRQFSCVFIHCNENVSEQGGHMKIVWHTCKCTRIVAGMASEKVIIRYRKSIEGKWLY